MMWTVTQATADQEVAISKKLPLNSFKSKVKLALATFNVSNEDVRFTIPIELGVTLMLCFRRKPDRALLFIYGEYRKHAYSMRYDIAGANNWEGREIHKWIIGLTTLATNRHEQWLKGADI